MLSNSEHLRACAASCGWARLRKRWLSPPWPYRHPFRRPAQPVEHDKAAISMKACVGAQDALASPIIGPVIVNFWYLLRFHRRHVDLCVRRFLR
ncbi:MAG: hypothetical protein ACYCS1_07275 [Gammaproteobacteria bacterium]